MTVVGEAFVDIHARTAGFEGELEKGVTPGSVKVAKTVAGLVAGAFVAKQISAFARAGLEELKEAQAVQAQTAAAIASTGGAANVTSEQVEQLAGSLLKVSGVDDELITKGANLLLTFTKVRNEVGAGNDIFDQATKTALDLSRAGFGSVESASVLLGKALNDPIKGVTALQRVGVRLTDAQKEQVAAFERSGDTLSAQKVILEEVTRQVGGSAEAYGKTLPGQLEIAQQSLANVKGEMVAGLAPALQIGAEATSFLTEQFQKQPKVLQQVEGGLALVVGGLGAVATPLKSAVDLWRSFQKGQETVSAVTSVAAATQTGAAASTTALAGAQTAAGASAVVMAEGEVVATTATRGLVAALGPLALVAGVVAVAMGVAASGGDDVAGSIERLSGATDDELIEQYGKLASFLEAGGIAAEAASKSLDALVDAGESGLGVLTRMRDVAIEQGESTEFLDDAIKRNIETTERKASTDDAATRAAQGLEASTQAVIAAIEDETNALRAQLDPFFAVVDAANQHEDAQRAAADAQVAATEAGRVLLETIGRYGQGSAEATEATRAYETAQRDASRAQFDTVQSAAGLQGALLGLEGAVQSGETSVADATSTLDAWVAQGLITQDQANRAAFSFGVLGDKARDVPGNVGVTVTANTQQAQDALDRLISRFGIIQGQAIAAQGLGILYGEPAAKPRAHGGPVWPGDLFLVGENGPELARFGAPARVFDNDTSTRAVAALASSAGHGGGMQVVLQAGAISVVAGPGASRHDGEQLGAGIADGLTRRLAERRLVIAARTSL